MGDHATPNLPSRDSAQTIGFYEQLGFETGWHDSNWLILKRGSICLEFFRYPDLDPADSSFSCCLRLDDVHAFHKICLDAGVLESTIGWPRLQAPKLEHSGMVVGYLVDIDGTLLRLVQNPE